MATTRTPEEIFDDMEKLVEEFRDSAELSIAREIFENIHISLWVGLDERAPHLLIAPGIGYEFVNSDGRRDIPHFNMDLSQVIDEFAGDRGLVDAEELISVAEVLEEGARKCRARAAQ